MNHLLAVLRNRVDPHPIRLQAARTLDDILLIVPRNIGTSEERKKSVQCLMLEVLAEQVSPDPITGNNTTVVEIRKMGLETLHQILQFAGHTLLVGWEIIFEMLGSACEPTPISTLPSIPESIATSPTASPQPSKPPPLNYSAVPSTRPLYCKSNILTSPAARRSSKSKPNQSSIDASGWRLVQFFVGHMPLPYPDPN